MIHQTHDISLPKGWYVGPWNSDVPVAIGYANVGVNEFHHHSSMYEVYLIARGTSVALVNGQQIDLHSGDILVVEPYEIHTFVAHSEDYLHFVIQTPFIPGDKVGAS